MEEKKTHGITSNVLKLIACASMLCDHTGYVLMDDNAIMRAVGRLAFPIFVFLLVEGYRYTSNVKRYMLRLFAFALISEVPFDLAFSGRVFDIKYQNIFFTLAAGLIVIRLFDMAENEDQVKQIYLYAAIVAIAVAAEICGFDYGGGGIIIISIFYKITPAYGVPFDRSSMRKTAKNGAESALIYFLFYGFSELYALFALVPISFYNGRRGIKNRAVQYAFYMFYPLHLLCIYLLTRYC